MNIVQKDTKEGQILRMTAGTIDVASLPTESVSEDIRNMKEALATQHDGVALAAPQIGISKRMFVIAPLVFDEERLKNTKPHTPQLVFINPEIVKISKDKKKMDEGCLSVRGYYGEVRRASRATVRAHNESGEQFEITGTGLLATNFPA